MKSMIPKPTIMILGGEHLANPGMDTFNKRMDDVLAPKRQREIEELVQLLKRFKPTKIALEVDERFEQGIQTDYQDYLEGTYELKRGEGDQIGFRLAKEMEHSKLYCVDYWPASWPILDKIDTDLLRYDEFAKTHAQEHLLPPPPTDGKVTQDEDGVTWVESEKYENMVEIYKRLNHSEGRLSEHQGYLRQAQIGRGTHYPGANWVAHSWYSRNLKIFVNITRITEFAAEDRILLIIGAGHVFLLQQFLEDSGDYLVESPLKYLDGEESETS